MEQGVKHTGQAHSRDMVYIGLFAVLISVCAWISIPWVVPFTLQTFGVFFTLVLLGGKRGSICILVYILLGALGIPVFSGFQGGPGVLFGTTGGYILGFLLTGLAYWGLTKALGERLWVMVLGLVVGLVLCYAAGTAWFLVAYARQTGPIGMAAALGWCVTPFLLPDVIKMALALALGKRLNRFIPKAAGEK